MDPREEEYQPRVVVFSDGMQLALSFDPGQLLMVKRGDRVEWLPMNPTWWEAIE